MAQQNLLKYSARLFPVILRNRWTEKHVEKINFVIVIF